MRRGGEVTADSTGSSFAEDGTTISNSRVTVSVRIRPQRQDLPVEKYDTTCLYCTYPEATTSEAPTNVTIINPTTKEQTDFAFDRVFDESENQDSLYSELVEDAVMQTLDRNGDLTVVAYGQTGSGKTFTMLGERSGTSQQVASPSSSSTSLPSSTTWLSPDSGVFLRVMNTLLAYQEAQSSIAHTVVYLSAVELYNDAFIDLLARGFPQPSTPSGNSSSHPFLRGKSAALPGASLMFSPGPSGGPPPLEVRECGENLILTNVQHILIDSLDAVQRCFDVSHKNRSVSATAMNDVSSRSHAIFQIDVAVQRRHHKNPTKPDMEAIADYLRYTLTSQAFGASGQQPFARTLSTDNPSSTVVAPWKASWVAKNPSNDFDMFPLQTCRITLVDLAGSERVKRSGVVGKELQEAVFVNSSLSTLGLVVHSLCSRLQNATKHIPFRDSKMTRFLRPCFLSPHANIIFITNLSPTSQSYVETLNSMRFASRLKDLKLVAPSAPGTAGPSLGTLLSDERLQRLRQQVDEMAADVRIYLSTWGASSTPTNASVLPRQRRTHAERFSRRDQLQSDAEGGRNGGANDASLEIVCRAGGIKEATQRAREDWTTACQVSDAELHAIELKVRQKVISAAKGSGRLNEEEANVTKIHLQDSLQVTEAALHQTRTACAAELDAWLTKVTTESNEGEAVTRQLTELSKRKRELHHAQVQLRSEEDEIAEESAMLDRGKALDSSRLAAERSALLAASGSSDAEDQVCGCVVELLTQKLARLVAMREGLAGVQLLDREAEESADGSVLRRLIQHEISPEFTQRLATAPLCLIFDTSTVRTSQGVHRILNERLEQASAVFTVSPLAFYFNPGIANAPNRFVPWAASSGRTSGRRAHLGDNEAEMLLDDLDASDDFSDDGSDDESVAKTIWAQSVEAAAGNKKQNNACAAERTGGGASESSVASSVRRDAAFYLRTLSLFGLLMRTMHRSERRRSANASSPLFTSNEVRTIFAILDAVEVEPRVVERVVRRALLELRPPLPSNADLSASFHTPRMDVAVSSSFAVPDECCDTTREVLRKIQNILRTEAAANKTVSDISPSQLDPASGWHLPCLLRCLQALSAAEMHDAFFVMHALPSTDEDHRRDITTLVAQQLVEWQASSAQLSDVDQALLKGCRWASRIDTGAGGTEWAMDEAVWRTQADRECSRSSVARCETGFIAPFLWQAKPRDLSLLRSMTTRCLIRSKLIALDAECNEDEDSNSTEHVPTPSRFLECLHLVFRSA